MKAFAIILCSLTLYWHPSALGQNAKKVQKAAMIAALVDSQTYVFKAQTALPSSGQVRQLTAEYDLTVTPASIVCDLPYFGRAYVASIDPSQAGIQFSSTEFEYRKNPRKKGGWDIIIKPKGIQNAQQLILNISENGYCTLEVLSVNRQQIGFNGYITAVKQ